MSAPPPARNAAPIVILGVSRRSGTNFLARLLACHADCAGPADPVREDHLLARASLLLRYARATARRWPRHWGDRDGARAALERHLGAGLASFLQARTAAARVVTKTPSPRNVTLYPRLFPDAHLLLLVRDGRSATESLVRGFGFSYERAMREWRAGARRIAGFLRTRPDQAGLRVRVVRYERLAGALEDELPPLLRFLDLDPDRFDLAAARDLPVFGSSFLRGETGEVTWQPIERTESFDPSRRFAGWSRLRHERFEWCAGRYQRALGYPTRARGGPLWAAVNVLLDIARPAVLLRDATQFATRNVRRILADRGPAGAAHTRQSSSP